MKELLKAELNILECIYKELSKLDQAEVSLALHDLSHIIDKSVGVGEALNRYDVPITAIYETVNKLKKHIEYGDCNV